MSDKEKPTDTGSFLWFSFLFLLVFAGFCMDFRETCAAVLALADNAADSARVYVAREGCRP